MRRKEESREAKVEEEKELQAQLKVAARMEKQKEKLGDDRRAHVGTVVKWAT